MTVLATDQRLRRAGDFETVIRRGRRAGRNGLVVHVYTRDPHGEHDVALPQRAGFVVSRTVGTAVTRNKVRRRLRHLLRAELAQLEPGTDLVVRVLPEAADRTYDELGRHLRAAIQAASRRRAQGAGRG